MAYHDMKKVLEMNRRPEDILAARKANALAAAIFRPSTHPAGQSSLGAAREDERKRMVEFFAALNSFRTIARNAQKHTEITAIDKGISELLAGLEDVASDAGITQAAWAAAVEEMR